MDWTNGGSGSLRTLRLAGVLAGAVALSACGPADEAGRSESGESGTAEPAATVVRDSVERATVVALARPVAASLMETLSGELRAAMEADGAVGAMEFCNVQALPLTRQVSEEQGMTVGRTSLRLRNPANAADRPADAALTWFAEEVGASGAMPGPLVQRLPGGDYRFYQPLGTRALCTSCHGTPEALAAGVPEALDRLYPQDEAVGYQEGDWRGLLHVTVPATEISGQE